MVVIGKDCMLDESKDMDVFINSEHLLSLSWFLKQRLTDLKYQHVRQRVKEYITNDKGYKRTIRRRFEQKMIRYLCENGWAEILTMLF